MIDDRIEMAADFAKQANEKYFEWVRPLLSVTTGSLAGLIALQDNYVPSSPNAAYLLWVRGSRSQRHFFPPRPSCEGTA
jgi:hypothetical protein